MKFNQALLHEISCLEHFQTWDAAFLRFPHFPLWWPQITIDLSPKTIGFRSHMPIIKSAEVIHLEICSIYKLGCHIHTHPNLTAIMDYDKFAMWVLTPCTLQRSIIKTNNWYYSQPQNKVLFIHMTVLACQPRYRPPK